MPFRAPWCVSCLCSRMSNLTAAFVILEEDGHYLMYPNMEYLFARARPTPELVQAIKGIDFMHMWQRAPKVTLSQFFHLCYLFTKSLRISVRPMITSPFMGYALITANVM